MPLLDNPTIFLTIKLIAELFFIFLFLPLILSALICTLLLFFILLPVLCPFILALLFYKIVFRYFIKYPAMILVNFSTRIREITFILVTELKLHPKLEGTFESKQVSEELDLSEFPSMEESEEEEEYLEKQEVEEEKGESIEYILDKHEDAWQTRILNSIHWGEHKSFHEILSYWRRKEREDI